MQLVSIGYPQILLADTVYAMPSRALHMLALGSFTSIDFANSSDMIDALNIVTAGEFHERVSTTFIRFNAGNANVSVRSIG